jgi:branched-chain amino acid transport system ATP-binding protein
VVDQNVRTVLDIADRVYVVQAGRIVFEGPAATLRDDPKQREQWGLAA